MKWEPSDAVRGDVIRVRLGSIWHYGIFVSPDEVIAFGLPPVDEFRDRPDRFSVVSTDIGLFCCGKIPEKAVPDRAEAKKRRTADETVAAARARIGEGGYNIIHNNCEHFVYECAWGEKKCTLEEEARQRWKSRILSRVQSPKK